MPLQILFEGQALAGKREAKDDGLRGFAAQAV
jgi:hypothetical protein